MSPTFTEWAATTADHKAGWFGIAFQDSPGVFKAPTQWLRLTGGSGFVPDAARITPKYFNGVGLRPYGQYAGSDYQGRSVNVELDALTLSKLIQGMWGPPTAGTITPRPFVGWARDLPLHGISAVWYVPTVGYVEITDAQFYQLQGSVPQDRNFVTATLNFHALKGILHTEGEVGYTPPTAVIPAFEGAYSNLHASLSVGGTPRKRDGALTFTMMRPIEVLTPNGEFASGFKVGTEYSSFQVQTTFSGGQDDLVGLHRGKTSGTSLVEIVFALQVGDDAGLVDLGSSTRIAITASTEVTALEVPLGDGAVQVNATFDTALASVASTGFTIDLTNVA